MNTYEETIEYLYSRLPMFARDGATAINKGLNKILLFCEAIGNPQNNLKAIHIAGTNGKGSTSHMLAAILSTSGYRTGLYTSPHLLDFKERIRVDGVSVGEDFVIDFVTRYQHFIEQLQPSFFEVTVAMSFYYFNQQKVDAAVIEVGLGGRLDSTNIIQPILSLITNISFDHVDVLGDTLTKIAAEKAGVIKPNTPVVISEKTQESTVVFQNTADRLSAPIYYAEDDREVRFTARDGLYREVVVFNKIECTEQTYVLDLAGKCQSKNILGVLKAIDLLRDCQFNISEEDVHSALNSVCARTELMGRWQLISEHPKIIGDTGHNADGIAEIIKNLDAEHYSHLHVVLGTMKDKDLQAILSQFPADATYYFCAPDLPRSMPENELRDKAAGYDLLGESYSSVGKALLAAKESYRDNELIFVGGSTFVVAEVLRELR